MNPTTISDNRRAIGQIEQLRKLLDAMRRRDLPEEPFAEPLSDLNKLVASDNARSASFASVKARIERTLEHEYGLVRPDHYQNQWMALGMSAFGLPLGVAFSAILGNMAYIGIGLPIGLAIGLSIGAQKDRKAREAGKVLKLKSETDS